MPKNDHEESPKVPKGLLGWDAAASYLDVTPRLVRELWQRRELAAVKVGRRVRFREEDLVAFIERNRVEAVR